MLAELYLLASRLITIKLTVMAALPLGRTRIEGFKYGVYASVGSVSNHLASVRDCRIDNTHVGVWCIGYNNPLFVANVIEAQSANVYNYIDRFQAPLPVQGLRVEHCRRYVIEGNRVTGGLTAGGPTYGIVVIGDALSATRNVVYRNVLEKCQYGAWSEGNNAGVDRTTGLCYVSNTFTDCERDVETEPGATLAARQSGFDPDLGQTVAAGNAFASALMQFAARGNRVDYFSVGSFDQPDPNVQVFPITEQQFNPCLPIHGFRGGQNPPCESDWASSIDGPRVALAAYYANVGTSEALAAEAQLEHTREFAHYVRDVVGGRVDGCGSGTVVEWEDLASTEAPWAPLDKALARVYHEEPSAAKNWLNGLTSDYGQSVATNLGRLVDLREALAVAEDDGEAAAALQQHDPLAPLSESELGQTYAQALSRAVAAQQGLAPYEPRLSVGIGEPAPRSTRPGATVEPAVDVFTTELTAVRLVDPLGRTLYQAERARLTRDELGVIVRSLAPGVYYLSATLPTGETVTQAVGHAR